jgi:hypothetical protein
MPHNEPPAGRADPVSITLPAEQRDVLYSQLRADLLGVDDLRLAIENEEFATAERLGRRFVGALRLILDGLGWGDQAAGPVNLVTPPAELRPIIAGLRETAVDLYEAKRDEQEAFRASWERTALVRDACDEILNRLPQ